MPWSKRCERILLSRTQSGEAKFMAAVNLELGKRVKEDRVWEYSI
jgi:hypothetical protein